MTVSKMLVWHSTLLFCHNSHPTSVGVKLQKDMVLQFGASLSASAKIAPCFLSHSQSQHIVTLDVLDPRSTQMGDLLRQFLVFLVGH